MNQDNLCGTSWTLTMELYFMHIKSLLFPGQHLLPSQWDVYGTVLEAIKRIPILLQG